MHNNKSEDDLGRFEDSLPPIGTIREKEAQGDSKSVGFVLGVEVLGSVLLLLQSKPKS